MPTRAAAKREAAFLAETSLSSPPVTSDVKAAVATKAKGKARGRGVNLVKVEDGDLEDNKNYDKVQLPGPTNDGGEILKATSPIGANKRKRAPAKTKKTSEPVTGGWDVLPHGMGKKGDLVDGTLEARETPALPSNKRARKNTKVAEEISDEDEDMLGDYAVEPEDQAEASSKLDMAVALWSSMSIAELKELLGERGLPKSGKKADLIGRLAAELINVITDNLADKLLENEAKNSRRGGELMAVKTENAGLDGGIKDGDSKEDIPKTWGRSAKSKVVKNDEDGMEEDAKDEDFQTAKAKKRAPRKKKAVDTSDDVLEKVDDLIDASGKAPKSKKGKKNPYGLTPGYSPFPDFPKPTPEDCEEVTRLLSKLHGEVKAPDVIPPPSMEVTGCGEVPDLLDAILRTLLSASTTAANSNMALKGLKDRFGLRTSGIGEGSVNWEAVHDADLETVIDSIKSGGLAKTKGTNIKKILDVVWEGNLARRDALVKEKETGEAADVTGAEHEPQEAKDDEISKVNHSMLSMDYVFELTTDEAMTEMTKLPGIGVKTASCVILFCMKRPSFAVDTHVWRHCKWLGWVPQNATRDQTFSHCEVRVPDHLKYPLHQLFLRHGKTCGRCRAATGAESEAFTNADCPIDHLMNRMEKKKMVGAKPKSSTTSKKDGKKAVKGKGKGKGKSKNEYSDEDEDEEEEIELSELEDTGSDEDKEMDNDIEESDE